MKNKLTLLLILIGVYSCTPSEHHKHITATEYEKLIRLLNKNIHFFIENILTLLSIHFDNISHHIKNLFFLRLLKSNMKNSKKKQITVTKINSTTIVQQLINSIKNQNLMMFLL